MPECPTCEREDFKSERGMKQHHKMAHDESLAYTVKECEVCGKENEYRDWRLGVQSHFFCGKECRAKWESERMMNREVSEETKRRISESKMGEDHPLYGKELTEEHKENIRKALIGREITWGDKVGESNRGNRGMVGEENPRWTGGERTRMGPDWKPNRRKALKRDYYTCRSCGMTNEEHKEEYGREIQVHHKTPRKWFIRNYDNEDYGLKLANRLRNLITVCYPCHHKLEAKIQR